MQNVFTNNIHFQKYVMELDKRLEQLLGWDGTKHSYTPMAQHNKTTKFEWGLWQCALTDAALHLNN